MSKAKARTKRDVTATLAMLHADMEVVMEHAERVLEHYGIAHWRLSLICRNPEPGHEGEWINTTSDDPAVVAATIVGQTRCVIEPDS